MLVNHPKLDVLYNPLMDDSEHACKSSELDALYNPLLNDSEHACKSPSWTVTKILVRGKNLSGQTKIGNQNWTLPPAKNGPYELLRSRVL